MSYEYPVEPDEERAASLLRERGWNVTPPRCPDCKGWGTVQALPRWTTSTSAYIAQRACPRGCPVPALIL